MRVLYPETEPVQYFQAKAWVGGDSADNAECTSGAVRTVVAYLRSVDNCMTSTGTELTASTYQLQQWRNINRSPDKVPQTYDHKWQLKSLTVDDTTSGTHHFRMPRTSDVSSFTFYIDTDKFVSGTYKYKVISFEKLEKKLHLMSKWPEDSPTYNHIEDNIAMADIFNNMNLQTPYNDSPIVAEDTFTAPDGEKTVSISPMKYDDPDDPDPEAKIYLSDFVICIKAEEAGW
jgi:hypothetical protein